MHKENLYINHFLHFSGNKVIVDDNCVFELGEDENYVQLTKRIFNETDKSYSKYYKMDRISKLAFLSSELLLKQATLSAVNNEKVALVFSNSSATIETDTKFQNSIKEIPSPATFVYTLPNIMVGEICIRNNFKGENLFFIEPKFNANLIVDNVQLLFVNSDTELVLTGWVDFYSPENYSCYMTIISKEEKGLVLSEENLNSQFKQ